MRVAQPVSLPVPLLCLLLGGCSTEVEGPSGTGETLAVEARSIDTIGIAGALLSTPLEVRVRKNGVYAEGVRVFWRTASGSVQPSVSVTDARGIARGEWTLGNATGPVSASAATDERSPASVAIFRTVAYEPVSVVMDSATNAQRATVGTMLPRRLRVHVRNAMGPRANVAVYWSSNAGAIGERSVTDANGFAETEWRLPTTPVSVYSASALIPGFAHRIVSFSAEAHAGPVVRLVVANGSERVVFTRSSLVAPLMVRAFDTFGNRVTGAPVLWSVVSGPVTLKSGETSLTDYLGSAAAVIEHQGVAGEAVVKANAGNEYVTFSVQIEPGVARVTLDTQTGRGWLSNQNGSQPALDTLLVGETIVFGLSMFDYDNHDVTSIGEPAFAGGREFPYAHPSEVRITFTKPGLYHYQDSFTGAAGSVLVVNTSAP